METADAVIWKVLEKQRGIKELIERGDSDVQQFYRGASVLVTGGSGFLGKQLIEKLLRTCRLSRVYMLIRPKKGKSVGERVTEIVKDPLFDTLRENQPDFVDKIVPIAGELAEIDLALSAEDREVLIKEVDVIFHVAATISFQEPLRSATLTNVRGTRDLLALAKQCSKLRKFVYVSTAYSHGTFSRRDSEILEQFYRSPVPPATMIRMAETMDEHRLNGIQNELIKDWPNTYSFTKALAEDLIRCSSGDLPISVIRPSIVICARREPYPGWIDTSSVFGPSGITLGCMMGVIHSLQSVDHIRIDFIPVDYVNNVAIVSAASPGHHVKIYNVGSSKRNYITWGDLVRILKQSARQTVSTKAIWYCFVVQTPYRWLHLICSFLLHTIPAHLADGICVMLHKPPRLKKTYATINKMSSTLSFYTNNHWIFNDSNTVELYNSLSPSDKAIYHCNITDVDWKEQIVLWYIGLRKYIVKDGLKSDEWTMKKQIYFRIATYVISVLFICMLYYLLRLTLSFMFV